MLTGACSVRPLATFEHYALGPALYLYRRYCLLLSQSLALSVSPVAKGQVSVPSEVWNRAYELYTYGATAHPFVSCCHIMQTVTESPTMPYFVRLPALPVGNLQILVKLTFH